MINRETPDDFLASYLILEPLISASGAPQTPEASHIDLLSTSDSGRMRFPRTRFVQVPQSGTSRRDPRLIRHRLCCRTHSVLCLFGMILVLHGLYFCPCELLDPVQDATLFRCANRNGNHLGAQPMHPIFPGAWAR